MPIPVAPDTWLDTVHREYLSEYIKSGGSAVKFISGDSTTLASVPTRLHALAEDEGYFHVHLDAAKTLPDDKKPDLHRIDRFFFAVTESVDWRAKTTEEARKYLDSRGVVVHPGRALRDIDGIAQDNGRTATDLINQFQRELVTGYIKDQGMAIEFRTAISALVRAQLLPDTMTPTTEEVLLNWFAGRTMPGASAALKKIHIFERITRANARHMLASFCRWLPRAGHSGLVVTLDFRPYEHKKLPRTRRQTDTLQRLREAIAARASWERLDALLADDAAEPAVSYSDLAFMQMLAQLRRFIDEIDWFERFMLVVLTTPRFYDDSSPRNYWAYDALQSRIGLEVHDVQRANPAAALVHLGGAI
jgi:hypothetical protein